MKRRIIGIAMSLVLCLCILLQTDVLTAEAADTTIVDEITVDIPDCSGNITIGWISDVHIVNDYDGHSSVTKGLDTVKLRAEGFKSDGFTSIYSRDRWFDLIDTVNSYNPDIVILGGDLMDYYSANNASLVKAGLARIKSPYMYLRADHDYGNWYVSMSEGETRSAHKSIASDAVSSNVFSKNGITIVGITNSTSQITGEQLSKINEARKSGRVILATHVPYASKVGNSLKALCMSRRGKEYYWGSATYTPSGSTSELINIIQDGSSIPLVLTGHLHSSWDGEIVSGVRQHIFSGGYAGNVGIVHINGIGEEEEETEEPSEPDEPELIPPPVAETTSKDKYTFFLEEPIKDVIGNVQQILGGK